MVKVIIFTPEICVTTEQHCPKLNTEAKPTLLLFIWCITVIKCCCVAQLLELKLL